MHYDIVSEEFTIYNDDRKPKISDVVVVESFNKIYECYAYLDGIQQWNEEEINISVNRPKKGWMTVTMIEEWGTINITYSIRKSNKKKAIG